VSVFETNTEAQQPVRDASRLPGGGFDKPVCEAGGVLDQRVRGAKADCGSHEPNRLHHDRSRLPPAGNLEGDHRAGAAELDAVGLRVEHALDSWMCREQTGEHPRALLRLAHPEGSVGKLRCNR